MEKHERKSPGRKEIFAAIVAGGLMMPALTNLLRENESVSSLQSASARTDHIEKKAPKIEAMKLEVAAKVEEQMLPGNRQKSPIKTSIKTSENAEKPTSQQQVTNTNERRRGPPPPTYTPDHHLPMEVSKMDEDEVSKEKEKAVGKELSPKNVSGSLISFIEEGRGYYRTSDYADLHQGWKNWNEIEKMWFIDQLLDYYIKAEYNYEHSMESKFAFRFWGIRSLLRSLSINENTRGYLLERLKAPHLIKLSNYLEKE